MTTDLSQLHPQKDFSSPRRTLAARYWIAVGLFALTGTGYAAFQAFGTPQTSQAGDHGLASAPELERLKATPVAPEAVWAEEADEPANQAAPTAALASPDDAPDSLGAEPSDTPPVAPETVPALQTSEPSAVPAPPATVGAYYVQLASYHTKERADAHAKALAARGLPAQSVAYGGPEAGWWHAVRMGPYKERIEAERQRFDLEIQDRQNAYVLPRSNGKFHVQVASLAEREEAEQVRKRFSADGHNTKITRVKMSGSYWHCVRIGPFDTRDEATAYKSLVADIPGSQSTVIPFGPPPN